MGHEELLDRIRQKRLILCVTTGRSGTAYLASIFGFAQGVYAVHEPDPEFANVLRSVQNNPNLARKFLLEEKLPAILRESAGIYIETSHLACKGFLEPMLAMGIIPDLIIHRRPPRDVALSMYRMGTIPGRSDKGLRFYLSPLDSGVLRLLDWERLHDYQICYWYCLEIEKRSRFYKELFQQHDARITETTLLELKSFSGLAHCFSDLNLKLISPVWLTRLRFKRGSGVKVNQSKETKKDVCIPENLAELEQEVISKIDSHDLQKWLPEMNGRI